MNARFFAFISRMKYIDRWALMRNTITENISEHSLETAFIAHALAVIRNKRFGGDLDPERCALLAMYHDVSEIITGDLPTPVKYYNPEIRNIYSEIEEQAADRLLSYLPEDIRGEYIPLLKPDLSLENEHWRIVKAADKLSALIKCIEERRMGNDDFATAEKTTLESIHAMELSEAEVFLEEFIPAYTLTLDEQSE